MTALTKKAPSLNKDSALTYPGLPSFREYISLIQVPLLGQWRLLLAVGVHFL